MAAGIALLAWLAYTIVVAYTRTPPVSSDQPGTSGIHSPTAFYVMSPFLIALLVMIIMEARQVSTGWVVPGLVAAIGGCATLGAGLFASLQHVGTFFIPGAGLFFIALAIGTSLFFIIEFLILRLLSLTRLGAIVRVTYYEALLQPFTLILLGLGVACVAIFAFFPFFTQNEEAKMFRDVGMSFCLIFTLPVMIFASSKVIDEEIENRTMLTLMSKPVSRAQVVIGKYVGVVMVSLLVMTILGIAVAASAYVRYFDDMRIDYITDPQGSAGLNEQNTRAIMALAPSLILKFLSIATLAAVAVAVSTRYGLAFNITAIVLLFLLANMTQFIDGLNLPGFWQTLVTWISSLLPHLNLFDIDQRLIYGQFATALDFKTATTAPTAVAAASVEYLNTIPTWGQIWQYVGVAALYGVFYIGAALSAAVALFRTRELT